MMTDIWQYFLYPYKHSPGGWLQFVIVAVGMVGLIFSIRTYWTWDMRKANWNINELKRINTLRLRNIEEAKKIIDKKERVRALKALETNYPFPRKWRWFLTAVLIVSACAVVVPWSDSDGWKGFVLFGVAWGLTWVGVLVESWPHFTKSHERD